VASDKKDPSRKQHLYLPNYGLFNKTLD